MADLDAVENLFTVVDAHCAKATAYGGLDILVNNAGIFCLYGLSRPDGHGPAPQGRTGRIP
ncbi:hypothetical protein ACSNOK_11725 [Streptomyces sp. URMC 126]|uniref:hypothetical protein n=1 Tax=Streptomyces sp. URMC 126 TaxID=3423401 RepID=UPI003F1A2DBB